MVVEASGIEKRMESMLVVFFFSSVDDVADSSHCPVNNAVHDESGDKESCSHKTPW